MMKNLQSVQTALVSLSYSFPWKFLQLFPSQYGQEIRVCYKTNLCVSSLSRNEEAPVFKKIYDLLLITFFTLANSKGEFMLCSKWHLFFLSKKSDRLAQDLILNKEFIEYKLNFWHTYRWFNLSWSFLSAKQMYTVTIKK